ncbi:tautomerase family protein [Saccharibacillus deserti]|uniref:tautomerase family protein n=1 Tax=Saccharibacillus deserti TaxID=1634444 RepID=UPI0015580E5E|nr:tautomerase family protein [Saccharibacillus deserti]
MGQIKIYGLKEKLNPKKEKWSEVIHSCMVEAFELPENKKFHRFFPMENEDFIFPDDRSEAYTIIEISIFEGRSSESKKRLIELLFQRAAESTDIAPSDLEITLFETPRQNWGIRGLPADELQLNYKINV